MYLGVEGGNIKKRNHLYYDAKEIYTNGYDKISIAISKRKYSLTLSKLSKNQIKLLAHPAKPRADL